MARQDGRAGTTGEGAEKPAGEASMDAGYETVMTPSGVPETRKRTPRVFPREEVAAYKPIGASNCYRHFTLDWNWQGGDINDYFKRSDPVAVAEFCQDINLDAVILLAVSHHGYATYPSAHAPQFPALQGRDWYGETVLRVKSPDGPIPLLHSNPYGKGRVAYLAATQDLDFVRSIIDFLAGPPPVRCEPPDRQAVLTYQKEQGRWALHLVDDGDYVVHTHRAFAEPEKVVGLYPAEGWQAQAEATENGLRIEVSGAAKDRILVLK